MRLLMIVMAGLMASGPALAQQQRDNPLRISFAETAPVLSAIGLALACSGSIPDIGEARIIALLRAAERRFLLTNRHDVARAAAFFMGMFEQATDSAMSRVVEDGPRFACANAADGFARAETNLREWRR